MRPYANKSSSKERGTEIKKKNKMTKHNDMMYTVGHKNGATWSWQQL